MNKSQLVEAIAADSGLTKTDSARAVESFLGTVSKTLKKGDEVIITGFGKFSVVKRAARQGVMLKLPGSDDAALHLAFAEASLADARDRVNPTQSLADAATELDAAFTELSSDRSSPLWPRYRLDEATFLSEEGGVEAETPSPVPAGATPRPGEDDTPSGSRPAAQGETEDTLSPATAGSHATPSPSGGYGGDGGGSGDDGGGSGTSPSPGQTPHPDN